MEILFVNKKCTRHILVLIGNDIHNSTVKLTVDKHFNFKYVPFEVLISSWLLNVNSVVINTDKICAKFDKVEV